MSNLFAHYFKLFSVKLLGFSRTFVVVKVLENITNFLLVATNIDLANGS